MRKSLHFIAAPQQSRHTVFLEGEEAPSFSPQQHFDTPAELLSRAYNRPRNAQLESAVLASNSAAQLSNSRKLDRYILAQSHTAQGQPGYLYPKRKVLGKLVYLLKSVCSSAAGRPLFIARRKVQ